MKIYLPKSDDRIDFFIDPTGILMMRFDNLYYDIDGFDLNEKNVIKPIGILIYIDKDFKFTKK
jgi:hypothetical protein